MHGLRVSLGSRSLLAGAVALNIVAALALVLVSPAAGVMVAILPLAGILAALALTEGGRIVLLSLALSLQLFLPQANRAIPVGSVNVHPQDLIVGLALGAWLFGMLVARRREGLPLIPRTPAFGWPLLVLAAVMLIATLRGHYAYGTSLVGQPLRFALYAAIVLTLVGMTPTRLYQLLQWLFYTGGTVTVLWAAFYIATGTSGTDQNNLSTGGQRVLEISTTVYCAGTLFLALLSLRLHANARHRWLHVVMAGVGLTGVILGFGRAVFAAVFLSCALLLLASRSLRRTVGGLLPLAAPFLILLAIAVPRVAPDVVNTFENRVRASPTQDANVQWRLKANEAVWEQIREAPVFGSGFGRRATFAFPIEDSRGFTVQARDRIYQDPHNGYLWLLAGGGVIALGAFLAILALYFVDSVRRYRRSDDEVERLVVLWALLTVFPALFDAATGTTFSNPGDLLLIWVLLAIPGVVPLRPAPAPEMARAAGRVTTRPYRA